MSRAIFSTISNKFAAFGVKEKVLLLLIFNIHFKVKVAKKKKSEEKGAKKKKK